MGREVRRVPKDWQHPKKREFNYLKNCYEERYQPMHDRSFATAMDEWIAEWKAWDRGERPDYCSDENRNLPYWEWEGPPPDPAYFMPDWPDSERTHLMMYEDTTEGTPISPAFETPEELARWLVDNHASAFGGMEGSYEGWLRIAQGGWAPGLIMEVHGDGTSTMTNGVDATL